MNLLAKSLGQLAVLAVALFFFSCEDENSLLGFKNPNKKFKINYVELPLESSVMLIDSIITDNKSSGITSATASVMVGRYSDNLFGEVKAVPFLQIFPASTTKIPVNSIYDSVTVQFRLNNYSYGFTGERQEKFTIHEITNDSLSRLYATRYQYKDSFQYDPTPLGEGSVTVNYDSLKKQYALASNQQDTLLATAKLDDEFGQRLFGFALNNEFKTNEEVKQFIYQIKGLALVPSESGAVLGLKVMDGLSKITIHYRTVENSVVKDTLTRVFGFYYSSFTNINTDRSGSELSVAPGPFQSFVPPSGMRYIQSGSPVISKLDLKQFYDFADADTNRNVIVNSAELVIDNVDPQPGLTPHSNLIFKIMNNNDLFTNFKIVSERDAVLPFYVLSDQTHFYINSDEPSNSGSAARLSYSSDKNQYSGFMTLFVQSLFKNRFDADGINDNRIQYLGAYPLSPTVSSSVERTAFNANDVKLRIYYTRPANSLNP